MDSSYEVISPAESAKFIATNTKYVNIDDEGVSRLSAEILSNLKAGNITIATYGNDGLHLSCEDPTVVDWTFIADTLNFCFWTPGNATKWKVDGETGYFGLIAALRRATKEGYDITNPQYYSSISEIQLSHIMRSDDGITPVPLLSTRVQCLHEVGKVLIEKYDGTFKNCVKEAKKSAVSLLNIIVTNFACFRDEAVFEGRRVGIYKRAQILVSDLWSRFLGQGLGEFYDIDKMTMFADYRVPQSLLHFGVMKYSPELMSILKQDKILENGCREEVEIRGCSIHAVELVNDAVRSAISGDKDSHLEINAINPILIDFFLWMYRRKHAAELEYIPFHKVFCRYY